LRRLCRDFPPLANAKTFQHRGRIANLEVEENKRYFLERIVLAGCVLELAQGRSLGDLPREALLCALAGCRWGLYSQERLGTSGLEETLTLLLFTETRELESFIRDTLEPFLFSGAEHVSGLHQVTHKEAFAHLIAALAMEWLDKRESMSRPS
jgi:hypothetical protein